MCKTRLCFPGLPGPIWSFLNAEKALTSYGKIISEQSSKIAELEAQIEGLKLSHFNPVSKTEAKTAPKTTASRKTGTKSSTSTK